MWQHNPTLQPAEKILNSITNPVIALRVWNLLSPVRFTWDAVAASTPPVLTRHGWLTIYHGVSELPASSGSARKLCYSAGVLVLSKEYPRVILYRSPEPVLTPELPQERQGVVPNVVFPTAIDRRDDLSSPDCFDVYYGMADKRIGVAGLNLPERLPPGGLAAPPEGTP